MASAFVTSESHRTLLKKVSKKVYNIIIGGINNDMHDTIRPDFQSTWFASKTRLLGSSRPLLRLSPYHGDISKLTLQIVAQPDPTFVVIHWLHPTGFSAQNPRGI